MKKITARANSNIALVKYWGKREIALNLPAVPSISITLAELHTTTSVCFDPALNSDTLILNDSLAGEKELDRVSSFLDIIRTKANIKTKAKTESVNNFPTSAGLASSASSFACLSLAASKAANLELTNEVLSEISRLGSGSAARSIYGGFVEMNYGKEKDGVDCIAQQLFDKTYWDLTVLIAITSEKKKKTGSTDGMELSRLTSPYYQPWIDSSFQDIEDMRSALAEKDFTKVADISEFSCLKMHALALASRPGLLYWNGFTVELIHKIRVLRASGIPVFFTIDAGPQVKAVCPSAYSKKVGDELKNVEGVLRIIETGLGDGAQVLEEVEC